MNRVYAFEIFCRTNCEDYRGICPFPIWFHVLLDSERSCHFRATYSAFLLRTSLAAKLSRAEQSRAEVKIFLRSLALDPDLCVREYEFEKFSSRFPDAVKPR